MSESKQLSAWVKMQYLLLICYIAAGIVCCFFDWRAAAVFAGLTVGTSIGLLIRWWRRNEREWQESRRLYSAAVAWQCIHGAGAQGEAEDPPAGEEWSSTTEMEEDTSPPFCQRCFDEFRCYHCRCRLREGDVSREAAKEQPRETPEPP